MLVALTVLIFVIPLLILLVKGSMAKRVDSEAENENIRKRYSRKLEVDLSLCSFGSGSDAVFDISQNTMDPMVTTLYESFHTDRDKGKPFIYLIFLHEGKKFIGGPVHKDRISAEVRMMEKKKTYIYYNNNDFNDYFFDLTFFDQED